jgi:uncharacterized protein YcfJ
MNRFISFFTSVALVLTVGCAELTSTQQGAIIGGGLGGVMGGLIDSKKPLRGALIGAAVGALAGAVIGHYVDKKEKSASETARDYNYRSAQGTVLKVKDVRMEPQVIKPGESSKLIINYAVLDSDPERAIAVTEKRELKSSDKVLKKIDPVVKKRNAGTYTTEQEVTFPANLPEGLYSLKGEVAAEGKKSSKESNFQVVKLPSGEKYVYAVEVHRYKLGL